MKRAKRPGRRIRPWWECGRGFVVFCHPEWGPELRKQFVETELPRFFRGELAMLNDNVTLSNAPGVVVKAAG